MGKTARYYGILAIVFVVATLATYALGTLLAHAMANAPTFGQREAADAARVIASMLSLLATLLAPLGGTMAALAVADGIRGDACRRCERERELMHAVGVLWGDDDEAPHG